MTNKELRKLAMRYKKELEQLTKKVAQFLTALDEVMKEPSTAKRGKRVAKISNWLEMANDRKMHFGLGYEFKKINRIKKLKNKGINKDPTNTNRKRLREC